MTDEDKKIVTEYLGECFLDINNLDEEGICKLCGQVAESHTERTFTDPADFFACRDRLVKKGDLHEFYHWSYKLWQDENGNKPSTNISDFWIWLTSCNPDGVFVLCELLAEAIRKGVVRNGT